MNSSSTTGRIHGVAGNSRILKRPAGALGRPSQKMPAVVQPGKTCDSMIAGLPGIEELPLEVRRRLGSLVGNSLSFDGTVLCREAATLNVRESLCKVKDQLAGELQTAVAKVDEISKARAAHEAGAQEAEAQVCKLSSSLAEARVNMRVSSKAMGTFRRRLKILHAGQMATGVKLEAASRQVDQLHSVDQKLFQPLKKSAAKGSKGHRQLQNIQRECKVLGFQRTLLKSLPKVLKKKLDKRRTVDGFVLNEFESEFAMHYDKFGTTLKEERARFEELTVGAQEARSCLADSELAHICHDEVRAEMVSAIGNAKTAMLFALQNVRKLDVEAKKSMLQLSVIRARFSAFCEGPLAALQALNPATALTRDSVPSTMVPVSLPAAGASVSGDSVQPLPVDPDAWMEAWTGWRFDFSSASTLESIDTAVL